KTSIFSHPVYLFLREFSLQDFRGGSDRRYLTSTTNNRHVATKPKLNSTSSVPIFLIHLFSAECVCYLQRTQCILRTKNHVNR
ncbi:hypothetical protein C9002_10700, partial [Escherichia coli]